VAGAGLQVGEDMSRMGGARRRWRMVLGSACLALWIGLMIAGLWPFNFWTRNRVTWLANPSGVYFDGYGEMYSAAPWHPDFKGDGSLSLEMWLKAGPYPSLSPILSWLGGKHDDFVVAQSLSDLLIEGEFLDHSNARVGPAKFFIEQAFRDKPLHFLTVTSGPQGTTIYLEGVLSQSHPDLTLTADSFSGRLLLGHAPAGNQPWSGEVYGLAFYARTLKPSRVAEHYQAWLEGRTWEVVKGERDAALYTFDGHSGSSIRDRTGVMPDLTVPKMFHLQRPTVLGFPADINRYEIPDIVENILGFIPFGFCIAAFVRLGPRCAPSQALVTAVLIGTATSLAIELLQVYLPSRDSSSLDLINNILGSALGALLATRFRIPSARAAVPVEKGD
jgi:hypothetical protein